jgi:Holliday junction DNA helicase RuvB
MKRIRDYVIFNKLQSVDVNEVSEVLNQLKIFRDGLTTLDIEILKTMYIKMKNRPVSLETVSLMVGENKQDISTIHEPYLVENGYIIRTKRGRIVSEKGIEYLNSI